MFHDVLLETTAGERRRRELTLLATLAGEALVIAALVALPLLYLDAIPGFSVHAATRFESLAPAPVGVTATPHGPAPGAHGATTALVPVSRAPLHPLLEYGRAQARAAAGDDPAPDLDQTAGWGCPTCVPGAIGDSLAAAPPRPAPLERRLVISHIEPGMVLQRFDPPYPPLAKLAHVQGEVVLRAVVSRDGTVEELRVVSGHPLLVMAARDAVARWRFRPYQLNGSPIEVEAQITVRFVLAGGL